MAGALALSPFEKVLLGSNVLGGVFSSQAQAKAQNKQTKEQQREFNINEAPSRARLMQTAGLRDRLVNILMQRFGNAPNTYAQAQAGYQPSPDMAAQQELYRRQLHQLGYNYGGPTVGYNFGAGPGGNTGPAGAGGPMGLLQDIIRRRGQ